MSITCDSCKQKMLLCNFCSDPFCGCKSTSDKPQFKANPFNKLYQTHFDVSQRDDDMIRILNIENPRGDDLNHPVFVADASNRDIVTKATLDTFVSENGEPISNASFEKSEIKAIYYNLYFDNWNKTIRGFKKNTHHLTHWNLSKTILLRSLTFKFQLTLSPHQAKIVGL